MKLFSESKKSKSKDDLIVEILSKPGWKKIEPPSVEHWLSQLEYKLTDDVTIQVLDLDGSSRELHYYLIKDGVNHYINYIQMLI